MALYGVVFFDWTVDDLKDATGLLANVCGVMVGFILTAVSVLASIGDKQFIQRIKKSEHYYVLLAELEHASLWLGACFVGSIVVMFLQDVDRLNLALIACASFFAGVYRFARSFFMFSRVMRLV